jgi:hypothetical protein
MEQVSFVHDFARVIGEVGENLHGLRLEFHLFMVGPN